MLVGWLVASAVLFSVVLAVVRLVACGVSGCRGGGFGPVFSPREAQVGLLLVGLTLVPLALYLSRGRRRRTRIASVVLALVAGPLAALAVLGLGPDGCPLGQSRAVAGPDSFSPGALTCSSGRDGG